MEHNIHTPSNEFDWSSSKYIHRYDIRSTLSSSKHLHTFTKEELSNLLGIRSSDLGRLRRTGVFQRIGADKYLVDYHMVALLLSKQDKTPSPMSAVGVDNSSHGSDTHLKENNLYQSIRHFYHHDCSLLENSVNVINVPDLQHATLAAGVFVDDGLQMNQRAAMLSFVHPSILFSRFAEAGLTFDNALQSEQLVYLYYKPDVARSINLSVNYNELFDEIVQLSGGDLRRLVLFNVDALINTNSEHLVHSSLHQLIYAASHHQVTLLGLFVDSGHASALLDEGCRAILPGYFVMG